jgi:hypothetical protein
MNFSSYEVTKICHTILLCTFLICLTIIFVCGSWSFTTNPKSVDDSMTYYYAPSEITPNNLPLPDERGGL